MEGERRMDSLNRQLDPTQTGLAAGKLELDLRKRVVGQDEAVQQIVHTYQTFLAGMSGWGRPIAVSFSWGRPAPAKLEWLRRPPRAFWAT